LVVTGPLLGVGQDTVRFVDLLEPFFGIGFLADIRWYWRAIFRKAVLISSIEAFRGTPRIS